VKYAFISKNRNLFKVRKMCDVLAVSRGGYYDWQRRAGKPAARQQATTRRDALIKEVFVKRRNRYGSPRVARDLRATGVSCNEKTVAASMQRQGLVAKAARKFKATTNSNHNLPVAPNLLEQDFAASRPNQKWCGDITYLWTSEGWLYLATVIDLYSRRVIGWSMNERMTADLVCNALQMAVAQRGYPRNVIVHSDRGSQYCSNDYQAIIRRYKLRCSMSKKADCFDNACAESFFHSLKVEAIHGQTFPTRTLMRKTVFEYIEVVYNRDRQHSTIGYISPCAFEALPIA
jgi:putative transposase